ncbi:MAG: peptide deformylase [Chlamydiae bacterium]|nr:peptide deformylase [Chlamydiota bacterium]
MTDHENLCPCCSKKKYEICCKPFHEGALPENALLLMRSRYSAYVLNIPDYIVATTHPASPEYSDNKFNWKRSLSKFSRSSTFHKLEILDFKENNNLATVTFTVYLSQDNHDATFTERSYFEKIKGRWLYRGGQLAAGHAPNLVTNGQLRLLPLAYYGDSILRKKADPVAEITNDIRKLVEEMIETMDASDGIGLAAVQIHHSIRLFVIRTPIETGEDKFEPGEIEVFINPILSLPSKETWKASEGCLSIPSLRSLVERPKEITVEYTSLNGNVIKKRVSGWQARVIMHENDHLDGVLFTDRLDQEELLKSASFLQSLEKRMHDGRAL